MMKYKTVINKIIESYKNTLGDNLIGIYLHGSYVMSGFNPRVSDLDFLVVLAHDVDDKIKRELINVLLDLDDNSPSKGFEMSIMLLCDTKRPKIPTKFLLHYSSYHQIQYLTEKNYICQGQNDPDLLVHLTVIKARGQCIYGYPIDEVFGIVDKKDYLNAVMYDLNDARHSIDSDITYYVLNMCRTLYYIKEGVISSKSEGGTWALTQLPNMYTKLIQNALDTYMSKCNKINIPKTTINAFFKECFAEIDQEHSPE